MNERDRRVVIRAALDRGETVSQIARMTGASRNTIRRVREEGVERAPRQAARPARTPELVEEVRQQIENEPRQSINAMARDYGIGRSTMQRVVRKDLGLYSYAKGRGCQMNPRIRRNRCERAQALLNRIRHRDAGKTLIFSDERYFTLRPYHNRKNDQVGVILIFIFLRF